MILQALAQLAENEKLIADPDFEFRPVAWIVRLRDDGTVIAIEDNRRNLNEGQMDKRGKLVKQKWVGMDAVVPRFPTGRSGIKPAASFMVDMAKFVFGQEPGGSGDNSKLHAYVERFRELVVDCEAATNNPSVTALRKLLDSILSGLSIQLPADAGPSDLFMFRVGADDGPIQAHPVVRAYWKQRRATPAVTNLATRRFCLVTGKPVDGESALFPLIKRVPGGSAMGVGLVSFNARAWESYGWDGNDNAVVSREAAEAGAAALNRLLDPRPIDGVGRPLPIRRIKLNDDTVVVFWSPEPEPEVQSILDALPDLLDPREETTDVGNLIASYRTGMFKPLKETARFYALTLTGTQGRVVVRDWLESTVADIQRNVAAYFNDLKFLRPVGSGRDIYLEDAHPPTFRDVKLAVFRTLDDVPASFGRSWLQVVWSGHQARVPPGIASRVATRVRIACAKGDPVSAHAFALLKLFVSREGDHAMKVYLNEDHPSQAYHCGRLLAVLDFAQQRALGDTNTTNVRRMLGAVMTAPGLYLGRLRKLTETAYLPKLAGDWPRFLRDRIQSVSTRLRDDFPRLLQMREQSTFFLGMDQERTFLQSHPVEKYKWQTSIGLWVQSRGERYVVHALVMLGHPFVYEPGLQTNDGSRLPDFMIPAQLDADRTFIEYFGMVDVEKYHKDSQQKIAEYSRAGITLLADGGGPKGKLIVLDNQRHPDEASIFNELRKQLGQVVADDGTPKPEGDQV